MRDAYDEMPYAEILLSAGGIILVLWALRELPPQASLQDPVYFLIFVVICALGAVATLFPRRCSPEIPRSEELQSARYTEILGARIIHGHHRDCKEFANHEILFGGKRVCAGCLGLLIGSVLAVVAASLQFTQGFTVPPVFAHLGLIFVVSGLAYSVLIPGSPPSLRTVLNALLVTGFALIYLILVSSRGLGLLGISLSVFWMYTRIKISGWSHDRLCADGEEPCPDRKSGD